MITSAARMRDGIRSARINKFAKALLLYVAPELYGVLLVPMFRERKSRLFIGSIRPKLKVSLHFRDILVRNSVEQSVGDIIPMAILLHEYCILQIL